MTARQLVYIGDPRLRNRPKPVTWDNPDTEEKLTKLFGDMVDTMLMFRGVGLAATQIGVDRRCAVILIPDSVKKKKNRKAGKLNVLRCTNLEIVDAFGVKRVEEGCLSIPEESPSRLRAQWVKVRYQDLSGNWEEREAEDLLAQIFQHEYDHLNGRLFVDYDRRLRDGVWEMEEVRG